jgi:hypothetical protein
MASSILTNIVGFSAENGTNILLTIDSGSAKSFIVGVAYSITI